MAEVARTNEEGANRRQSLLVTGANGFVGRKLCAEAIQRGLHVRAATRDATALPGTEAAVIGNIDGRTDWTAALRGINTIVHLAARVHVLKEPSADPLAEFLKVNRDGTENLARQAVQAGVKRLVFASSIKVNGEGTATREGKRAQDAFTEADIPSPSDAYAVSKWQAEQALQRVAMETGLEVVNVRPPLVYGPDVKGNFLRLMMAIDRGAPLPLAGAHNARSLLFVGNLTDALILCATHPAAAGQTYLVSDGEAVSTAELAAKTAQALGRANRCFYLPPGLLRIGASVIGRAGHFDRLFGSLVVDDAKIRRELGWMPPYTFEQGLRETADWYVAQRNAVGYNRRSS